MAGKKTAFSGLLFSKMCMGARLTCSLLASPDVPRANKSERAYSAYSPQTAPPVQFIVPTLALLIFHRCCRQTGTGGNPFYDSQEKKWRYFSQFSQMQAQEVRYLIREKKKTYNATYTSQNCSWGLLSTVITGRGVMCRGCLTIYQQI